MGERRTKKEINQRRDKRTKEKYHFTDSQVGAFGDTVADLTHFPQDSSSSSSDNSSSTDSSSSPESSSSSSSSSGESSEEAKSLGVGLAAPLGLLGVLGAVMVMSYGYFA